MGRRLDRRGRPTHRAGRDGWVPGWLSPSEMARGAGIVRETAVENGRDPDKITIAVEKLTVIDHDQDAAMARALPTVQTSSNTYERDVDQIQFALTATSSDPSRR